MHVFFLILISLQTFYGNFAADGNERVHMCGVDKDNLPEGGCECNNETQLIICDNVVFIKDNDDDGEQLSTPDVDVNVTTNPIKIASFRQNNIQVLQKGKILNGHEKTLEELYFTNNRITKIEPGTFNEMEKLRVLDLGFNRLQKVDPSWFVGAKWKLKYLNLENNSLISLPNEVFKTMPMLESLILDGNPKLFERKTADKMFHLSEVLKDLKNLSMNSCRITNLTDDFFANLTSLEVLSLANNYFTSIPLAVKDIPSLLLLDLSEVDITEIHEDALLYNKNLQRFYCVHCEYLEFISECGLCGLHNLVELDLRGCIQLRKIDEGAFGYGKKEQSIPRLEFFSIQQTQISSLSQRLFDGSKLSELAFGDTPWSCTCDSAWILQLELDAVIGPKCQAPVHLKDKQLMSLTQQDLCPGRSRFTKSILSLFIMLTAVMIIILIYYLSTNYRIRNIFYRPDMPHIGYSNLNHSEEEEQRNTYADSN